MSDYYHDRKYCPKCREYVPYLTNLVQSYCVQCLGGVTLFSPEDREEFERTLATRRKVTPSDIAFGFKKK